MMYFQRYSPGLHLMTVILAVLSAIVILTGCEEEIPDGISTLTPIQSFGGGSGEGFLYSSTDFVTDRTGFIYFTDWRRSRIHQFDLDGRFIRSISTGGQGPGEISQSFTINLAGNRLAVADFALLRATFFNSEGEFISLFNYDRPYRWGFAASDEYIVLGATVTSMQVGGLEDIPRFNLFNFEGELIRSFGEFVQFGEETPAMLSRGGMKVNDGLLHFIYGMLPLYQIYDLDTGELLAEYNLEEFTSMENTDQNRDVDSMEDLLSPNTTVVGVHNGLDVVEDRVFVQRHSDDLFHVDEYRLDGIDLEFVRSHYYLLEAGGIGGIYDFFFLPERGTFYTLESTDEGIRVREYAINEPSVE